MKDFNCANPDDMQNAVLRECMRYFKETEGGQKEMRKVWDDIKNENTAFHLKQVMIEFKVSIEEAMRTLKVPLDQKDMYLKMIAKLDGNPYE